MRGILDPEREKGKREKKRKSDRFFLGEKHLERKNRKEDKRKRKSPTMVC